MKVKIINKSKHALPSYATPLSAGMDIRANIEAPITLEPLERRLIRRDMCHPDKLIERTLYH